MWVMLYNIAGNISRELCLADWRIGGFPVSPPIKLIFGEKACAWRSSKFISGPPCNQSAMRYIIMLCQHTRGVMCVYM